MGLFAIPISLILGFIILLIELFREKNNRKIDFLLCVNISYFICFCLIPLFLLTTDLNHIESKRWILKNSFESSIFFYASIISVIGYLSILFGYYFKISFKKYMLDCDYPPNKRKIPEKTLVIWGNILFFIGLFSLALYVKSIGGIWVYLEYGSALRSGISNIKTKWAFLKYVSNLMIIASYFFYGLVKSTRINIVKGHARMMFCLSFILSLFILFHSAGRLSLISYFVVFGLAKAITVDKVSKKRMAIGTVLSLFIILFGDAIFLLFSKRDVFYNTMQSVNSNTFYTLESILLEFAFPFVTLGNTIRVLGVDSQLRFFVDIPLAIMYLLPQRLLNFELPKTLSDQNTLSFKASGTVPTDILSFGYCSMGIAGVIIVCCIFGMIVRKLENMFTMNQEPIISIFKAAWVIRLSFIIMYGDPEMIIKQNFSLIVGTLIIILNLKYFRKSVN